MARVNPTSKQIISAINTHSRGLRRSLLKVVDVQRENLPFDFIRNIGGPPVDLIQDWQDGYEKWFTNQYGLWVVIWKAGAGVKFVTQELCDNYVQERANELAMILANSNAEAVRQTLITYADTSWTKMKSEMKKSIGLQPRQVSAFRKQSDWIRNNYPPKKASAIINRLYQKKLNYRAQLIARNEMSTVVNKAKTERMKDRIAKGELPEAMEKKWSTVGDNRVSDGCQKNENAEWIPIDDLFPSGHGEPPRFPGCRCGVIFRKAKHEKEIHEEALQEVRDV